MSFATKMSPRKWIIVTVSLAVSSFLFYLKVTEELPYFVAVSASQVAGYRELSNYESWKGDGWTLSYWRYPGSYAFSSHADHLILRKGGGYYDLVHFPDEDKQGATFWGADVIGNTLFVHPDNTFCPSGWIHLEVLVHGWWRQAFTMQSLGGWRRISVPTALGVPSSPPLGEVYRLDHGRLSSAGNLLWDDLFDRLNSGDYYIAPPGIGNAVSIDLAQVGTGAYRPKRGRIIRP
jgi:hypothetical protein